MEDSMLVKDILPLLDLVKLCFEPRVLLSNPWLAFLAIHLSILDPIGREAVHGE